MTATQTQRPMVNLSHYDKSTGEHQILPFYSFDEAENWLNEMLRFVTENRW